MVVVGSLHSLENDSAVKPTMRDKMKVSTVEDTIHCVGYSLNRQCERGIHSL